LRRSSSASFALAALACLAGCSTSSSGSKGADSGAPLTEVVVGIQSEPLEGALGSLHVVTKLGTNTSSDEVLDPSALPHEVKLQPPGGNVEAPISVTVDGYEETGWTPKSTATPLLVRTAETSFVPDQVKLLRVNLQGQCLLALAGGPPGGPVCNAPQTCIDGTCQSDVVAPGSLETYAPNWPTDAPDVCRGLDAGAPIVQVGEGQTAYLPLTSGESVQMEQGPQGGHHIWLAVRQKNIKQQGSTITITSVQPGTNLAGPKISFVFTFAPDQGGFCVLSGLRYQLDIDGTDYTLFLGKPLDLTVTVTDQAGNTGTGKATVDILPDLLCPAGTPGCPDDAGSD
jgi:hypothetical protein